MDVSELIESDETPKIFKRKFRDTKVVIDMERISIGVSKQIKRIVARARGMDSVLHKFPMKPGQSESEWAEINAAKIAEWKNIRSEGESDSDHVERLNGNSWGAQEYGLQIINEVSALLIKPGETATDVSQEEYDASDLRKTFAFIYMFLTEANVNAPEFDKS